MMRNFSLLEESEENKQEEDKPYFMTEVDNPNKTFIEREKTFLNSL
jgi:hypothetical protein